MKVRAVAALGFDRVYGVATQVIGSVVLARILTPEEIGIVSVAVALVGFAHLIRDLGLAGYIASVPSISTAELRTCIGVTLTFGLLSAVLLNLVAEVAAAYYADTRVGDAIRILAISFLIIPFSATQLSLMLREGRFLRVAFIGVVSNTAFMLVSIGLATADFSYLSNPAAAVVTIALTAVMAILMRVEHAPILPSLRGARALLRRTRWMFGYEVATHAADRVPELTVSKTRSFADGAYLEKGLTAQTMAIQLLTEVLATVALPRLRESMAQPEEHAKVSGATLFLMFLSACVAGVMLTTLAEPLILTMFGEQWRESVGVLSIVALSCPALAIRAWLAMECPVQGRYRLLAMLSICQLLLAGSGCMVASIVGLEWVALVTVASTWVIALAGAWVIRAHVRWIVFRQHLVSTVMIVISVAGGCEFGLYCTRGALPVVQLAASGASGLVFCMIAVVAARKMLIGVWQQVGTGAVTSIR